MQFGVIEKRITRLWCKTPALLIGPPGIGKTQFCRSLAGKLGLKLVCLDCSQSGDSGDLIGLLEIENHVHHHTKPEWMDTKEATLVFIDEINRAKGEIIAALMKLCSPEQSFNGFTLPEGSRVVVAINPSSVDSNQVLPINRALFTRFARYHVEVDAKYWCRWAANAGLNQTVIRFIDGHNSALYVDDTELDSEDENTANPRSWENFARLFDNAYKAGDYVDENGLPRPGGMETLLVDATSTLGPDMAKTFTEWFKKNGNTLDAEEVLHANEWDWVKFKSIIDGMSAMQLTKLSDAIVGKMANAYENSRQTRTMSLNFWYYYFAVKPEIKAQMYNMHLIDLVLQISEGKDNWLSRLREHVGEDKKDMLKSSFSEFNQVN